MTSYRTSMREALKEVWGLEEKFSSAQIAQLKKAFEPMRGKKISMKSSEKLRGILDKVADDKETLLALLKANIPFVSRGAATRLIDKHNMKGAEINKLMASYNVEEFELEEEVELDEAKYDLYHKDFSSAMQHAYKMAKKLHGITVDPEEIDDKVATGPSKPSEGKTNKYRLKGDKGAIQVQVYNKGGSKPFELNMYKEEVELDEALKPMSDDELTGMYHSAIKWMERGMSQKEALKKLAKEMGVTRKETAAVKKKLDNAGFKEEVDLDEDIGALIFGGGIIAALLPVLFMAVREIIRGTPLESSIKKIVDKLKKNKNYKMSDSEKSDVKGFVSKVKKEKPSLLQKAMKKIKEEVELDENLQKAKKLMGPSKNREQGIEFVMKGLKISKQKATQMVDKILDEEVELDEGRMKELHGYIEQGMSAKEIAKKMKLDIKTIQALMPKKEEVEEGAAADARRAMRRDPDMKQRAFSKDDSATDDERKAASKNIMMQMRKAVSLRSFDVEFSDGKKVKIPQKVAQAVLQKYNSFRKPVDKEKYQAKVGKSYKDMLSALKEDIDEKKMTFGTKRIPAAMKKKGMDKVKTSGMAQDKSAGAYIGKMKKESTLERMNKKIQEKKNG